MLKFRNSPFFKGEEGDFSKLAQNIILVRAFMRLIIKVFRFSAN
ncbi:hypothetical protein SAMN04489724_1449 [Algoriphagus locisalis]|uniref:Uncharacterized protein n=1 Tax=Algoriphagus locisalis TaxID=305507 RepID=A0A1I6ZT50_9BACT|nr:hypothetical protein SAMN04489724_1449 [Algoriphagus locisalis]